MTEAQEQELLFERAVYNPIIRDHLFSIPNDGKRSPFTGSKFVKRGLKRGVPDVCLPYPSPKGYHAAYIEMKRRDGKTTLTSDQANWIAKLRKAGNYANVAYGWEDAWQQLEEYLKGFVDK